MPVSRASRVSPPMTLSSVGRLCWTAVSTEVSTGRNQRACASVPVRIGVNWVVLRVPSSGSTSLVTVLMMSGRLLPTLLVRNEAISGQKRSTAPISASADRASPVLGFSCG